MNDQNIKLAIQKGGRLTEETLALLRQAGFEFESYAKKLFATCRNFPLEIVYVRDDDIPDYVASGSVDIGVVGLNLLYEEEPVNIDTLLTLKYGFCALTLAVPKESTVEKLTDLDGKTIATTYPNSTKQFFAKNGVTVKTIKINGSVEIAPTLGVADAIADLTSTGSTLALNDLRPLVKIYDSEAVLIANKTTARTSAKQKLLDQMLLRFGGVLSAKNYKYVMINAPAEILPNLQSVAPGLKSPTVSPLAKEGWISVQTVIAEDKFWETIENLKSMGATDILVLPIEKIIL